MSLILRNAKKDGGSKFIPRFVRECLYASNEIFAKVDSVYQSAKCPKFSKRLKSVFNIIS